MAVNIRPPASMSGSSAEQLKQLYSYLYQLSETLNIALEQTEQTAQKTVARALSTSVAGTEAEDAANAYQKLKALIVKTANDVTVGTRRLVAEITDGYRAQSEFGTYEEYIDHRINAGAEQTVLEWDRTNSVTTSVAEFDEYLANSKGYIRVGLVKEYEDGTADVGVVIGQELRSVTIDGKETITSSNLYSLLTSDSLSFWRDGAEISRIGLEDFFIEKGYIGEVTTNLLQSDTFGVQLALRDDVLQAIAGNINLQANDSIKLMVTNAVDGLRIGGRNYAMNTGTAYTAESDGSERKWLFPWNCAGEALGKSLYGQTVTVSFDYDQDIASGTLTMRFNHTWGLVKSFAAGQAEGQRFEGTFELPVPETFAANQPAAVLYLDGTWDGSVTISNLKLETGDKATDWTPAPEDPASGVKTSYIEIADDHVDVSSGGNVNIQAGGSLNVDSAEFNVTTEDFQMSLAKADGEEVVMDIDEDGHTTFKAIHAGNVREAEYDYKLFTTESMGSLSALADYLKRTDARVVEYRMSADEYGSVKLGYYNGYVKIVANSHRLPQIYVDYTFSGTLWITDGYLSAPGTTVEDRCLEAHNGRVMLDNCWFTGEVAYGLYAAHMSEVRWSHTSTAEKQGYTLTAFLWARYGGAAYYRGYIPGGGIWPDTGWVQVSGTPTVVSGDGGSGSGDGGSGSGDGGSGSGESAASVTGTLGYYGTKNGWHASECFQGYSNAKGRAYACLTFDLSGVGTIQTAKLTLHRKSGAGLNRKCTVTVYGTTAARGSSPISGMTDAYTTATELVSWDANGTIDVTAAAKALKSGTIAQIVFYTGETGTYDSKAYSYHYAQFDSASMAVTYT